jgi:hypothetical protein
VNAFCGVPLSPPLSDPKGLPSMLVVVSRFSFWWVDWCGCELRGGRGGKIVT